MPFIPCHSRGRCNGKAEGALSGGIVGDGMICTHWFGTGAHQDNEHEKQAYVDFYLHESSKLNLR
jgi:hypothetical protein